MTNKTMSDTHTHTTTNTNIYTQTITFTTMRIDIDDQNIYHVDNITDHINRLHSTIYDLDMCKISKNQIEESIHDYIGILQDQQIHTDHSFCVVAYIKSRTNILELSHLEFSHRPLTYTDHMYNTGLKLQISNMGIHSTSLAISYKTNNYLDNKIQLSHLASGMDGALRFNEKNFLCEGCYSNAFIIDKDNNIKTPSLDNGLLSGIMRKKVIAYCKEKNYSISETNITIDDIKNAESIFITNSLMGVMWINELKDIKNTYTKSSILDDLITTFQPKSIPGL